MLLDDLDFVRIMLSARYFFLVRDAFSLRIFSKSIVAVLLIVSQGSVLSFNYIVITVVFLLCIALM